MKFVKFDSTFGWKPAVVRRIHLHATSGVGAPNVGGGGAPAGGSPSPAPAPAAAPPAAPAPSQGGSPGAPAAPPPANGGLPSNAPNLDILRNSHELVTRLGGPEAAQRAFETAQTYTTLANEATQLAETLGYTPESLQTAFQKDPVGTLTFLRNEANQSRGQGDPNQGNDLNAVLDQRLGPLEQIIRQQAVERANGAVDTELSRVFGEHAIFKGKSNIPPDVTNFIQDLAREYMKYDQQGLQKVHRGDLSAVGTHFNASLDRFLKAVNAYNTFMNGGQPAPAGQGGQPAPGAPGAGQPPANKWSLSDLINGEENAFQGLTTTRR